MQKSAGEGLRRSLCQKYSCHSIWGRPPLSVRLRVPVTPDKNWGVFGSGFRYECGLRPARGRSVVRSSSDKGPGFRLSIAYRVAFPTPPLIFYAVTVIFLNCGNQLQVQLILPIAHFAHSSRSSFPNSMVSHKSTLNTTGLQHFTHMTRFLSRSLQHSHFYTK